MIRWLCSECGNPIWRYPDDPDPNHGEGICPWCGGEPEQWERDE